MGKTQSKPGIRLALVGRTGCGKSAFVNAIRGFADDHKEAAKVGVHTFEPKEYPHKTKPNISFCDLPGYDGPQYPDSKTYWSKFELGKFDGFLLFTKNEIMKSDQAFAELIRGIKTPLLVVYTHVDTYCQTQVEEKGAQHFNEKDELQIIKEYLVEHMSCKKEEVFLINNNDPNSNDFYRLIEALTNMDPFPEDTILNEETRRYYKENGVCDIDKFVSQKLEGYKDVRIQFAITGNAGTGKSAFINAIRGIDDEDVGAAEVDINETTKAPEKFTHPNNPMISFVDLPGIGTPNYPDLQTYLEKTPLANYDTFLIFTSSRFSENDLQLAKKVKSLGKSFFLIRTKIDVDLKPKKGKAPINEEQILEKIRKNLKDNITDLISSEKEIFLISNYNKDKWDFDSLVKAIGESLPLRQRECLILTLSNFTRESLKRKVRIFKAGAVAVAGASATASVAIPIPGVAAVADVALIMSAISMYYRELGLNILTDHQLAKLPKHIKEIIRIRYRVNSVKDLATLPASKMLVKSMGVEEASKVIPIVGAFIAGTISFIFMLHYLRRCISELEEAALAVWDDAAKRSMENSLQQDKISEM